MPLSKRVIEPIHISRGTIPHPDQCSLQNELEAVTNGTLSNVIRQLSSLSRHAEDLFGELAREARNLASRANSLQARLDKLAVKTTQLDSTVEEVSLQELHMRKAFKSAVVFDQQVVCRNTMPTAMLETYNHCDKPPPLYKLNPYREDGKDGMKFYTDPDYFFQLWRQEMLKDTERMMLDRVKKPHKPRSAESSGGRPKRRVRAPHSTRKTQTLKAVHHGEYIMPNNDSPYAVPPGQQAEYDEERYMSSDPPSRPNSIDLQRNYPLHVVDNANIYSSTVAQNQMSNNIYYRNAYESTFYAETIYRQSPVIVSGHHQQQQPIMSPISCHSMMSPLSSGDALSPNGTPSRGSRGNSQRPSHPPPAPPSVTNSNSSTPSTCSTPTRVRSMSSGRETLPPPPPPPVDLQYSSSPPLSELPPPPVASSSPPPPPPPPCNIPPPPPPPPPLPYAESSEESSAPIMANGDVGKSPIKQHMISVVSPNKVSPPKSVTTSTEMNCNMNSTVNTVKCNKPSICVPNDAQSELFKAIRDGIKLRKVENIQRNEGEKVNAPNDVASILARRMAIEVSDSDSGSEDVEYDSDAWDDAETTANNTVSNAVQD